MPPKPRAAKPPSSGRSRNLLIAAGAAAVVVVGLVAASLLLRGDDDGEASPTTTTSPSTLLDGIPQDRAILGSEDATVTLIQFEDLQCPVCKRYQEEGFPGIVEEYVRPGEVKLRFVGLAFIGPDSEKALLYTIAAGAQGKLWQYADALYANQGAENSGWVTDELLQRLAGDLDLDWNRLRTDADGPAVLQQANSMATEAEQREVPGTPWFYVQVGDDEPYEVRPGSFAIEEFRQILDDALAG
ncbi:MAG TPA: thioredoxin domain-containing protein [Gaiella sp.]|nr:thioredoxin domain-containing protein [Gaiella sp.]